jgi:hypothetical protein
MNKQIEKLVEEYFPSNKIKAESLIRVFAAGLSKEMERYSDSQYRKYKSSTSNMVKDDPWVLGTSEGADYCVDIIKKLLDEI